MNDTRADKLAETGTNNTHVAHTQNNTHGAHTHAHQGATTSHHHSKNDTQSDKHTEPGTEDTHEDLVVHNNEKGNQNGSNNIVNPGACFLGDELMFCALEATACHGKTFKSHRELKGAEYEEQCAGWFSSHRGDHIGMCATEMDGFICTGHDSNCAVTFADHVPYCNLQHNHHPQAGVPLSLYGKCIHHTGTSVKNANQGPGATCVWSIDSCPKDQNNTFVPASQQVSRQVGMITEEHYGGLCTCDKVKVGACVHRKTNYMACAVSEDSCDPDSKFKTWQQMESWKTPHHCRLCDVFDKKEPVEIYTSPHGNGGAAQIEDGKCNLAGASIGGVVSGSVVTLFAAWMVRRWHRRRLIEEIVTDRDSPSNPTLENIVVA